MRASVILAILAPALAVSAIPQGPSSTTTSTTTSTSSTASPSASLSPCIITCSTQGAKAANCASYTDLSCICPSTEFASNTTSCINANCPGDLASAKAFQSSLCGSFGNQTNSINSVASSNILSASSEAGQSIQSQASSVLSVASVSSASVASAASVSATHTGAAQAAAILPGNTVTFGAILLGLVVGPLVLFA